MVVLILNLREALSPHLATPEGRKRLAEEAVSLRDEIPRGVRPKTLEAARIELVFHECRTEIAAAFAALDQKRRDKRIASIPSVIRIPCMAFDKLGKMLRSPSNRKTLIGIAWIIAMLMFLFASRANGIGHCMKLGHP